MTPRCLIYVECVAQPTRRLNKAGLPFSFFTNQIKYGDEEPRKQIAIVEDAPHVLLSKHIMKAV